jgi:hypothetical protein
MLPLALRLLDLDRDFNDLRAALRLSERSTALQGAEAIQDCDPAHDAAYAIERGTGFGR